MKITRKTGIFLVLLFAFIEAFSQHDKVFCKAVTTMNFEKAERMVQKVIKKNRKGQTYFNGEGSGYQIDLSSSLDSITSWLKKQDCVEDAFWDKCQTKVAIYPGHSTIGVRFKTNKGIIEKCFLVQEGTTGHVNLFCCHFKLFKSNVILVYKKMYDCKDFIERQKLNCGK